METNIDVIKRRLLIKYPFFGSVVANLKYEENVDCGTAGTDGKTIYYNPEFINSLSEDEQTFIFAHEVCHIAFDHIYRSEGKDKELWNIATDSVINAFLEQDGLKIVKGGVNIPEAINYNAEEMYQKLLEDKQKKQQEQQNQEGNNSNQSNSDNSQSQNNNGQGNSSEQNQDEQSQNNNNSNNNGNQNQQDSNDRENNQNNSNSQSSENQRSDEQDQSESSKSQSQNNGNENQKEDDSCSENKDVGHDTHSMWDKAIERKKQEESEQQDKSDSQDSEQTDEEQEKKKSLLDKLLNRNKENKKQDDKDSGKKKKSKSVEERKLQEAVERISEIGEKKAFNQNKIDRKKQLEELREALAKQSIGAGNSRDTQSINLQDIGTAKALIDWRKLLKEAIKVEVDWSYRNASVEDGVVTPYLEEIPQPETEILLDTSGSIDEILLKNFLRECKNILQTSKVKVGCFDTEFYGFQEVKDVNDIDNMRFEGQGGTDFDVAVNAFSRRVENKIIFTDGEADMPQKSMDAIWVVFGGRRIKPQGGKVINIDEEQLRRLYNYHIDQSFER